MVPGDDRQASQEYLDLASPDRQGKKVSASFLFNGTRVLFEQAGFEYERAKGKNHCVMGTTIAPS